MKAMHRLLLINNYLGIINQNKEIKKQLSIDHTKMQNIAIMKFVLHSEYFAFIMCLIGDSVD